MYGCVVVFKHHIHLHKRRLCITMLKEALNCLVRLASKVKMHLKLKKHNDVVGSAGLRQLSLATRSRVILTPASWLHRCVFLLEHYQPAEKYPSGRKGAAL